MLTEIMVLSSQAGTAADGMTQRMMRTPPRAGK
jgi:hypothetical protein